DPKRFSPKAMAAAISKAKDRVITPDAFAQMASNFYEEIVAKVYLAYERRKHDAGALDFDDLISETVRLFRDHPDVLRHYQERFRYILVDEYQDTSRAQYELVNQLASLYRNVCVVGDADQGVYSWRGATIRDIVVRVGTPYRVFGGVRFFQRREVKGVLGSRRLLLNPQDVLSFRRVVNMPKRGIGDQTVAAVEAFARDEDVDVVEACRRVDEI